MATRALKKAWATRPVRSWPGVLLCVALLALCSACDDDSGGGGPSALSPPAPLDLLLVLDTSNDMGEQQTLLVRVLPDLLTAVVGGDAATDTDASPAGEVHVGIVTTDMGSGGIDVPTCNDAPDWGDDGLLRTTPADAWIDPSCAPSYPPFVAYARRDEVPDAVAGLSCLLQSIIGCGVEQPLEAVLKALTPATSGLRFARETTGHEDGDNAGFLRSDSVLGVVILTTEDDCSLRDASMLDPNNLAYTGPLHARCVTYLEALHPVERYVDGIASLRSDPRRLVYALLAGMPEEPVAGTDATDPAALLEAPEMQTGVTPDGFVEWACYVPGRGPAYPARRLVSVGVGLSARGARVELESVCGLDYAGAVAAIAGAMRERMMP